MKAIHIGLALVFIGVAGLGVVLGYTVRRGVQETFPGGISGEPVIVKPQDLPPLYPVIPFSLTSESGETITQESLRGQIWVAMFFFTSCAGPCPIMTASLADVARQVDPAAPVRFVSITVDPETDTPERLRQYGERYGADFKRWHFLTGPIDAINKLALEGFKLGSLDEPIMHSDRLVLVDAAGNIRGYFPGTETEGVARLVAAIATLRKETK
jgi:protein SCO1/2